MWDFPVIGPEGGSGMKRKRHTDWGIISLVHAAATLRPVLEHNR